MVGNGERSTRRVRMIPLKEKLRETSLFLASAIYATPLWILSFLGLSSSALHPLILLDMPAYPIVFFLGLFLSWTIGSDWIPDEIELWQIVVAGCVFYYFLILLILLIVRGRRAKPANQQPDPS
jgi:hypothetical protein